MFLIFSRVAEREDWPEIVLIVQLFKYFSLKGAFFIILHEDIASYRASEVLLERNQHLQKILKCYQNINFSAGNVVRKYSTKIFLKISENMQQNLCKDVPLFVKLLVLTQFTPAFNFIQQSSFNLLRKSNNWLQYEIECWAEMC